jgi:hypothetical protein
VVGQAKTFVRQAWAPRIGGQSCGKEMGIVVVVREPGLRGCEQDCEKQMRGIHSRLQKRLAVTPGEVKEQP